MTGAKQNTNDKSSLDEQADTTTETSQESENDVPIKVKDLSEVTNSTVLKQLVERVESVEQENKELRENQSELQETVTILENTVQELEKRVTVLESRADHLNDSIESVEIEIKQSKDDMNRKREDLKDRITALEAELGVEDFDSDALRTKPSCEIERIAQMPKEMREEEMSRSVNRAVEIWEHFDEWSKPVGKGQLLSSSEIKKLLAARFDTKLEWVQVYRVMESFDKNTPDEYYIVNPENSGKSIIREYDD